jgi:hypothetical protein
MASTNARDNSVFVIADGRGGLEGHAAYCGVLGSSCKNRRKTTAGSSLTTPKLKSVWGPVRSE